MTNTKTKTISKTTRNMKRLLLIFVTMSMIFSAAAQTGKTSNYPKGKRVLVAYFSATGVTAEAAQKLANVVNGDLYAITPATAYSEADLDWRNRQSRSSLEMRDANARPELADHKAHVEDYDVVYLGYPIWWYTAPRIINSFVEAYNFTGKMIVPFATSGGSTIDQSIQDFSKAYPDYKWTPGLLLNGATEESIRQTLDNRIW